jgi:extradiol dioxygenase family protein
VLLWHDWEVLARHLSALNATFTLKPDVRFVDQPGEQATFFITDPAGNVLEFKALRTPENLFARNKDEH